MSILQPRGHELVEGGDLDQLYQYEHGAAAWGVIPEDDPVLPSMLRLAAGIVEQRTGRGLVSREVRWTYDAQEPRPGAGSSWRVHPVYPLNHREPGGELRVPWPVVRGIERVEVRVGPDDYQEVPPEDYEVRIDGTRRPARVVAPSAIPWTPPYEGEAAYRVLAQHGPQPESGEPDEDLLAALYQLTSYLYENRGCDAQDAWRRSGAASLASRAARSITGRIG